MNNTSNSGSMKGSASIAFTASATLSLRSYFSVYHFWAASHFARLADEIENQHAGPSRHNVRHRAYVISAIIESVAFLEAQVNELCQDAAENQAGHLAGITDTTRAALAAHWVKSKGRGSVVSKFKKALEAAGQLALDETKQPLLDANLLIGLRNRLVHYQPETVTTAEPHDLEKELQAKFPLNKLMAGAGNRGFDQILGAGCARWAVNTADALASETFKRLGLTLLHQVTTWDESP